MASRIRKRRKANSNVEIVLEDGIDIVGESNSEVAAGKTDVVATDLGYIKVLCMLTAAVARSSSGGTAIRYLLPVLWITSLLHIMARHRGREWGVW